LEEQPEAFDCETCEQRQQRALLSPHDELALDLYHALQLRVVQDLRLVPLVFDVLDVRCSGPKAVQLLDKLDVIHQDRLAAQPAEDGEAPEKD
jgi:hypothetical protein